MDLGERYQLTNRIGYGGMATIYHSIDKHTGKHVAIKVLRSVYSTDEKRIALFQQAAMISLWHPNIVQVYEYG